MAFAGPNHVFGQQTILSSLSLKYADHQLNVLFEITQFSTSFVLIALSLYLLQTTYEILSIPGSQLYLFGLDFGLYVFELLLYSAVYGFGLYLINKSRQVEKLQQEVI